MSDIPPGLACAYCGGRHARAAEVRECWERSEGASSATPTLWHGSPPYPESEGADEPPPPDLSPAPPPPPDLSSVPPPPPAPTSQPGPAPPPGPTPAQAARPRRPPTGSGSATAFGPVLGRSVVVRPGQPAPPGWENCLRAGDDLHQLEEAWRDRVPLVIEVAEEPAADEVETGPVWALSPSFSFPGEQRAHATFANAVDARSGAPTWALADEAVRLGAGPGGATDVVLADGTPAWCDGGPLEWRPCLDGAAIVPRLTLLSGSLAPMGDNETGAALAPDQLAAVLHPGGAARIIAPAGSGKTRVLTERARHLLRRWHIPGRGMTLVAFNKRAADEMSERTPDLPELQVRTLNALGLSLLSKSAAAAGPMTTIEEREVRTILAGLVDLPRRANVDPAVAWIEALSAVRLGLQDPSEIEAEFGGDVDGLPEVFDAYRRILADRRLVDFDEQIYRAIEVLLQAPGARRAARAACRVLLVDEFQDLTPAHLLLVRLLAGPDGAVFGVGDDDQTIYGYSGASPEWLIDFNRFFPTAGQHPLQVNYRCPVPVVEAARNLLTHNHRRVPKQIMAAPDRTATGHELEVVASENPLELTVKTVVHLLEGGAAPQDIAVLSRVNASLAPVQVALVDRDVPVRPAVDVSYLARGGVQAALAWLRLAVSPSDRLAGPDVAVAARRPSRSLSPKVIEWMSERPTVSRLQRLAGRLSPRDGDKVDTFVFDLKAVRDLAASGTTAAVLGAVRDTVGLDRAMELLEGSRRRLDRSAQTDDLDALVALATLHPEPAGFEEWLRQALRHPGAVDGVVLSTIHRVKGREWPHVVVHEVSDGLLPHRLALDIEEERRIFHVGLTRGSSSVHVVAGDPPSPFLTELAQEWGPGRAPVPARRTVEVAEPRAMGRPPPASGARATTGRGARSRRPPASPEVAEKARQALRAWRSARATTEHKPPYIFLHDRTLEALATEAPATMVELAQVDGIGPGKIAAYGDELLALIAVARGSTSP